MASHQYGPGFDPGSTIVKTACVHQVIQVGLLQVHRVLYTVTAYKHLDLCQ